jgi:phage minor structural protein
MISNPVDIQILNSSFEVVGILSNTGESSCWYDLRVKRQLNGFDLLTGEVQVDHEYSQYLIEESYLRYKDPFNAEAGWSVMRIKRVEDRHEDGKLFRNIEAEHIAVELIDDIQIVQRGNAVKSLQTVTNELQPHIANGWVFGTIDTDDTDQRRIPTTLWRNTLQIIFELANVFQVEPVFEIEFNEAIQMWEKTVHFVSRRGRTINKRFEYNKDLKMVKRIVDTKSLKTAIIATGKNGMTISEVLWEKAQGHPVDKPLGEELLGDTTALRDWGYNGSIHRTVYVEFPDITDGVELIQRAWDELAKLKHPAITYELEVVDLHRLLGSEYAHEAFGIGDTVLVIDRAFTPEVRFEARIVEMDANLGNPVDTKVTIGRIVERNIYKSINEQINITNTRLRQVDEKEEWNIRRITADEINYVATEDGQLVNLGTQYVALDGTVRNLDGTVETLSGTVTTIDGQVKSLDGAVQTLDGNLQLLDGTVIELDGAVTDLDGKITTLDGTVVQLNSDLSTLDGKVTLLDGTVLDLSGQVSGIDEIVTTINGEYVTQTDIDTAVDTASGKTWLEIIDALKTADFNDAQGYYHYSEGNGIWVFDTNIENPVAGTKAVALKGGRIALGQYDGTKWNWGTFIDGQTVNADFITAGSLSADRIKGGTIDGKLITVDNLVADNIKSGTLSSNDGSTFIDLDNNQFDFGNGAFKFDGTGISLNGANMSHNMWELVRDANGNEVHKGTDALTLSGFDWENYDYQIYYNIYDRYNGTKYDEVSGWWDYYWVTDSLFYLQFLKSGSSRKFVSVGTYTADTLSPTMHENRADSYYMFLMPPSTVPAMTDYSNDRGFLYCDGVINLSKNTYSTAGHVGFTLHNHATGQLTNDSLGNITALDGHQVYFSAGGHFSDQVNQLHFSHYDLGYSEYIGSYIHIECRIYRAKK